jgi:hypothetical protein
MTNPIVHLQNAHTLHSCNPCTRLARIDHLYQAAHPKHLPCSIKSSLPLTSSCHPQPATLLQISTSNLLHPRRCSISLQLSAPATQSQSLTQLPVPLPAHRHLSRLQGRCSSSGTLASTVGHRRPSDCRPMRRLDCLCCVLRC